MRALQGKKGFGVLDRNVSFGTNAGILYQEIRAALYSANTRYPSAAFIGGLGGEDLTLDIVTRAIEETILQVDSGAVAEKASWLIRPSKRGEQCNQSTCLRPARTSSSPAFPRAWAAMSSSPCGPSSRCWVPTPSLPSPPAAWVASAWWDGTRSLVRRSGILPPPRQHGEHARRYQARVQVPEARCPRCRFCG